MQLQKILFNWIIFEVEKYLGFWKYMMIALVALIVHHRILRCQIETNVLDYSLANLFFPGSEVSNLEIKSFI